MAAKEPESLLLDAADRRRLWDRVVEEIESYAGEVGQGRVSPKIDPEALRSLLAPFDFATPIDPGEAVSFMARGLRRHQVHTPHPRYYGLYNPAPTTLGIVADTLVAAFNPQLAAWSHSPLAVEIERHLVAAFGARFGYSPEQVDGTFAGGGAEANHTALVAALTRSFPEFGRQGVRALRSQPVLYVSSEGHDSVLKAARLCGLGTAAVRRIGVDGGLRMKAEELAARIREDEAHGHAPFLLVATAGTTAAGAIDPLPRLAELAAESGLWFHVDAAWGGAAALVPELRGLLEGIERADSITFDAHKWLSVPMGAGLFLTRHRRILERTFRVEAGYMPREAAALGLVDPYASSMQWSRRFIGCKVFLSLAVAGWRGYERELRRQTALGRDLRSLLTAAGWRVVNDTPLPVVCFVDAVGESGAEEAHLQRIADRVVGSGEAWISAARLGPVGPALRACITSLRTGASDLEALVESLGRARDAARNDGPAAREP